MKLKEEVADLSQMKGHYTVKNVNKRDDRNVQIRKKLREEKAKYKGIARKNEEEFNALKEKLKESGKLIKKSFKKVTSKSKKLRQLKREKDKAVKKAKFPKLRKVNEQLVESEMTDVGEKNVFETMANGEYCVNVRFCVLDLAGLEVVMGKIGQVMETVGDLVGVNFSKLPGRFGCQSIVDEGQALAKMFIREKVLKRSKSFGIHKDGTSRRKVKILDTSIRTEEGESYSLGFSSVVSETGEAIANEAKEKLREVAGNDENNLKEMIMKISYYMSDRAANEKKSNRCLDKWIEEYCHDSDSEQQPLNIHHLFCSAHVLLGFHNYTVQALNTSELYRNKNLKHPVTLMLLDASLIFVPVGYYRGLKNQWEAYCLDRGIKSHIKNYKDNRFNRLFEVAAQVHHHREDFIHILQTQKSNNMKQTRLLNALNNKSLQMLGECLAIFYHIVTGPYWKMVTTSSFDIFKKIIPQLKSALQICSISPHSVFDRKVFEFLNFEARCPQTREKLSSSMKNQEMESTIKLTSTLDAQLVFMEGGKYHGASTSMPPANAPLTNLLSERHFGHLDASQKRRPNSSLHHHTSVIMLKQTRKRVRMWFDTMDTENQERIWKAARTQGKKLRKMHRESDLEAVKSSLILKVCDDEDVDLLVTDSLAEGQMIAAACSDAWYPAQVTEASNQDDDSVAVCFSELGKCLGSFKWPTGKEIDRIMKKSVVETSLDVVTHGGGRFYLVRNAKDVQAKFKRFK